MTAWCRCLRLLLGVVVGRPWLKATTIQVWGVESAARISRYGALRQVMVMVFKIFYILICHESRVKVRFHIINHECHHDRHPPPQTHIKKRH